MVCRHSRGGRCGHEHGAKVPAVVDTLRWGIVCQEMDLSLSVPSNPSLQFPALPFLSFPLLCFPREYLSDTSLGCLWWDFFLQPYFYWASDTFDEPDLGSSSSPPLSSPCKILLCLQLKHMQTYTVFFLSLFNSVLNMYTHPSHLFML